MDLNYLHHRQQVELMRAAQADHPKARAAHLGLASAYVRCINDEQKRMSAARAC